MSKVRSNPNLVSLRSIAPSVFLPALIYEIGNGAIAPIVALTAVAEGASLRTAGFMLGLLGVGQILGDIPAGALADRVGDRGAMIVAGVIDIIGLAGCFLSRSLAVLGPALVAIGIANATYYLGRQSYLTEVVPLNLRARALSTLGGSHRIGLFIGPFVGAATISLTGLRGAFAAAAFATATAVVLLLAIPDVLAGSHPAVERSEASSWRMISVHRRLFATLGLAMVLVGAIRAARQTVLPLWAQHLGLDPVQVSIIFGISGAVDMALFYPAGMIMDRFGRLAIAVPSMVIQGGALLAIPLTHGSTALTVVAVVMSLGNGIGSGVMLTLGADTAPAESRARFLAAWRLFGDSGNAAGPAVVALVAQAASLAFGIAAMGGIALLAAAALARWVPRYSPRRGHDSARGIPKTAGDLEMF